MVHTLPLREKRNGFSTPRRMTGVTSHSHDRHEEIHARTCKNASGEALGEGISELDDRPQLPRRIRLRRGIFSFFLFSGLALSHTQVYEYELSSEPLHISAKYL
jgi:hypothetical protein